jgi:hypothetical protein
MLSYTGSFLVLESALSFRGLGFSTAPTEKLQGYRLLEFVPFGEEASS